MSIARIARIKSAELGGGRRIGLERKKRPGLLSYRDGHARSMGRIRKIDTRVPFRRNRDRADRRIETTLLKSAENRFHIGNREQLECPFHVFRNPAPQVNADAGNRAIGVDVTVRRDVIDGDPQWLRPALLSSKGTNDGGRQASANADAGQHKSESRSDRRDHNTDCWMETAIVHDRPETCPGNTKGGSRNDAVR